MTFDVTLWHLFSPLTLLLSFRVGVDTDQDTSVSTYRLLFKTGIKAGSNTFPPPQSSAVFDGSLRRNTKHESAWPFRMWYNFDHKYPSNPGVCNPAFYHQGAPSHHLKTSLARQRVSASFLLFYSSVHSECDQALTDGCPQLPEAPPDSQRTPPHCYAACLLWTVGAMSHQPSGL